MTAQQPAYRWPHELRLGVEAVDLRTGRTSSGWLGAAELGVLRELAVRPCSRSRLHRLVFQGEGEPSVVDAAVARLVAALGPDGHHVERAAGGWQLWEGPE